MDISPGTELGTGGERTTNGPIRLYKQATLVTLTDCARIWAQSSRAQSASE